MDATENKMYDLTGRVALVTGGAGLLGQMHAEALLAFGAKVVLTDSNASGCNETARRLGAVGIPGDLRNPGDVETVVKTVVERFSRIDILVNNAAAKSPNFFEPFTTFPLEDWNEVMGVNVTGVFLFSRAVGTQMVKQRSGSIISIASIYGLVGPDQRIYEGSMYQNRAINTPAVYSVSKGAVINLTRYLATYWADQGIRVNTITPGGVESGQNDTFVMKYSDRVPMGRMARKNELQGALIYLASDASSYVTGHNLIVDGGLTVW